MGFVCILCRVEVRDLLIEVCKSLDIPIDRLNNLNLDRIVTRRLIDHENPDVLDSDFMDANYSEHEVHIFVIHPKNRHTDVAGAESCC